MLQDINQLLALINGEAGGVAQPGQVDSFLGGGAQQAATTAGKPVAPKAQAGANGAGIAGLAALPLALGATQVRGGIEGSANAAQAALDARLASNTATGRAMANANPNVNAELAQRNATESTVRANSQASAAAQPGIIAQEQAAGDQRQKRIQGLLSGLGTAMNVASTVGSFMSDERSKVNVQDGSTPVQDVMRSLNPVQFDQPATGTQGQTGVMAQDLASTPAGAAAVQQNPQTGMLEVDTNSATQIAMAGLGDIQRQLDELKANTGESVNQVVQGSASPGVPTPAPQAAPAPQVPAPQAAPAPAPVAPPAAARPAGNSTAAEILQNALRQTDQALANNPLGGAQSGVQSDADRRMGAQAQAQSGQPAPDPGLIDQLMEYLRRNNLLPPSPIPNTRQGADALRGTGLVPSKGGSAPKA